MALAMNMGNIEYYMNMPILELLDFCLDYKELNKEIKEEMKRK